MSERTLRLKKSELDTRQEICLERLRIITDSYKKTEGEPMPLRRAAALSEICAKMPVVISDEELIVGNFAGKRRAAGLFPEFSVDWLVNELQGISERDAYSFGFDLAYKEEVFDIVKYWKGKTVEDHVKAKLTGEELNVLESQVVVPNWIDSGSFSAVMNYEKVVKVGLNGLIEEIKEELAKTPGSGSEKRCFLEAMISALKSCIHYAERHAAEARKLAREESNPKRKQELKNIAEVCEWVPANPARTFNEVLQSVNFLRILEGMETNFNGGGLGRVDQYAYSFWKKDIDEGRITIDDAQELIECWYIKIDETFRVMARYLHEIFPRYSFMVVTLGGQLKNGEDATNELSALFIDAAKSIQCTSPDLAVRYFDGISDDFMLKSLELVAEGTGMPKFLNDKNGIPWLLEKNMASPEEAWDSIIVGCQEYLMMGKTSAYNCAWFNIAKVLELALNGGVDPRTGKQVGPKTGNWQTLKTFDDVMAALREQADYFKKIADDLQEKINATHVELVPLLIVSALVDGCIKKGNDRGSGAAVYNFPLGAPYSSFYDVVGLINAADSLAAVKKNVFDDRSIGMKDLIDACKENFEGKEDLRQMLLRSPKFGNDDDYVDLLAREVNQIMNHGPGHRKVTSNLFESIGMHVLFGSTTGATPEGRKAWQPLADAGASPVQGMDKKGPTAAIKSAMKVDPEGESWGILTNMKISPALVKNEAGLRNHLALIKTYFDTKAGHHLQFNMISPETLKRAQQEPENYKHLVVRVAGFCAYFTQLGEVLQNEIIERTMHECF